MNRTINSILLAIAALFVGVGTANAQLDLKNDLGGATVNWYISSAKPTAKAYGNAATEGTDKVSAGQYIVAKVTPAAGKWTYPEMLTIQTVGSSGGAEGRTRGIDLPQALKTLGTIQADGAGLYYYQIPDKCTPANGYTKVVLEGTLFDKIDLSTATIDDTGKTVTATTGGWTATITLDEVSFTYNGSAQGPAISSFSLTNGTKKFSRTANHVRISGNSQTNASDYNATLTAVATGCLTGTKAVPFTITPLGVVVTIAGRNNKVPYDGTEHSVSGYDVVDISNNLYTENDFTFSGKAEAARRDVGKTKMNLTEDQFENTNPNFDVIFRVTDGYQEIASIDEVIVIITGHTNTADYDGLEHNRTGYDVRISNPLYNVTDFTFNATAEAKRTDVGKTMMGLKSDMFVNNNQNFEVTFNVVTDGYQEISPRAVTVTITGHNKVLTYDGTEHSVSGYDVEFSNDIYKEDYFTFSGTAKASCIDEGTTNMGLAEDQFENTNPNFDVTFVVTDGYMQITAVTDVVVTITGQNNTTDYDGKNHSVSGYDVKISNPLYKESDFTFSGKAEAKRTNAGTTNMELTEDMFENTNPHFTNVTFKVIDGYQTISPINVTVTIKGQQDDVAYDGTEHEVEGYNVECSNPLYTAADIAFSGTDVASQIDAGTTYMGLTADQFANTNNNFDRVTFVVIDGYQTIYKKRAVITVTVKPKTYDGTDDAEVSMTINGIMPGEKVTIYVNKGTFDNANPGADKKVTLDYKVVWDSAKEINYEVDYPTEAKGTIIYRRNSNIKVIRNDTGEPVASDAYLTVMPDGTMRVDQISIISPDAVNGIAGGVSIYLPATLIDPDGTTGPIYGVASDIIKTDANVPVTDIYMPDTEKPIDVGKQALRLTADESTTARIHTSLPLLADYALSPGLKAEYEAGNVMGVGAIAATTHYWTFSSAVDVVVPEGVTAYTCQTDGPDAVAAIAITSTTAVVDGKERVIVKANNGVMMGGAPGTYDLVAWPSADRPSGMTPVKEDAKSYEGNMLEPVIVETHYEPSDYYILYNNAFHELKPGDESYVSPGKAVLRKSNPNMGRILSIHNETSGIRSVYDDSRVGEGQWYSLDGRRLNGKPTAKGLYIHNGKKVIIK